MTAPTGRKLADQPSARWFLISSVVFFAITALVGVLVSLKFIWPEFMGSAPWLTFGRMRPLHVNGVLFGWLLAADIGLVFYLVPRLCGNQLWSESSACSPAPVRHGRARRSRTCRGRAGIGAPSCRSCSTGVTVAWCCSA
jgi:cbb3-type cytochrome oxidase subunit 1